MSNAISQNFDTGKLIRFTFPTIIMMVFLSMYSTVDGAFVSRLVSEDALSAINIVYPLISVFFAISLMLATGGNAIVAKSMGENRYDLARGFFSLIYLVGAIVGTVLAVLCLVYEKQILNLLGCTPQLYEYAWDYLRVMVIFAPMSFLQIFTQTFFVTAGRPNIGLGVIIAGGIANVVLDYVFIGLLDMGISGAAVATGIGYCIPGIYGIIYFSRAKKGSLYFGKLKWDGKRLGQSCFNGSSELVNNMSVAITTLLFNIAMLKYLGEMGVAAISVILYVQFIQASIYFGYSMGVAPVISYKYGEENTGQLKKIIKISLLFTLACSIFIIFASIFGADIAVGLFVRPDSPTYEITKHGFIIFSISYLFMGLNVFISSMFTAFGNGKVSALLSFLRTLLFLVGALLLLPMIWGVDGVWFAVPVAEALSMVVSIICFVKYRKIYKY